MGGGVGSVETSQSVGHRKAGISSCEVQSGSIPEGPFTWHTPHATERKRHLKGPVEWIVCVFVSLITCVYVERDKSLHLTYKLNNYENMHGQRTCSEWGVLVNKRFVCVVAQ